MANSVAAAERLHRRSALRVLLICITIFAIEGVDMQLLAFAAPMLLKEWGLTKVELAPALAAASFGMLIGSVLGGVLGDRWGRRPVIIVSVCSFGVLTLISSTADSPTQMALLRLLGGIGFGAVFPNAIALVSESAPPERRTQFVTLVTLGVPFGIMLGSLSLGFGLPAFGWRTCFAFAGALTLLCGFFLLIALPESQSMKERLSARMSGADDPGLSGRGRWARPTDHVFALFHRAHLRRTLGLWLFAFSLGYVQHGFGHWQPTMLTMAGLSLQAAIMSAFFTSFFMALGPFATAWGTTRLGSRTTLLTALGMYVSAHLLIGLIIINNSDLTIVVRTALMMGAMSLAGFAGGAAMSCQFALAAHAYPVDYRATGVGFATGIGRLSSVATAFGSALVLTDAGPIGFVVVGIIGLLVAAMATFVIDHHIPLNERG